MLPLTPAQLLAGYARGIFLMAQSRDAPELFWCDPKRRGIIPLSRFHLSRSTKAMMRKIEPRIALNDDFAAIVRACAARKDTWINAAIYQLYQQLHAMGHAHSLAVFDRDRLLGGVYGVALGGAFFGESMFSSATNGSKIAVCYLVARLRYGGFSLFDVQYLTDHLATLGAIEISRADYHAQLSKALLRAGDFMALDTKTSVQEVIHLSTQTS